MRSKLNRNRDYKKLLACFFTEVSYYVMICLVLIFLSCISVCCKLKENSNERPSAVDNSTTKHFPPIGRQKIGDCTCWSSCYYYNTYTQARDYDLDASTGDPEVVCSPRFLFSLISQGTGGAECTEHAMERLSDVGCATVSKYPMDSPFTEWPGEKAQIAALGYRTGQLHKIRVDNNEGLEIIKNHIADGGCAVTRGLFRANYEAYGNSASGPGINNSVMYAKVGENYLRHSLCICGYDDNRSYIDERDGKTYSGAFLIANSEGQDWGTFNSSETGSKGFLWVAYNMFIEGEFGLYDHDDNPHTDPCYDNPLFPTTYYHEDRPDYMPSLYAVAGINHTKRNMLKLKGGIGSVNSPDFVSPDIIELTDYGEIPINDTRRIVIDLSDGACLIKKGISKQLFIELYVGKSAAGNATITSADFYFAQKNDGNYTKYSSEDPIITVTPDSKGFATVKIEIP